MEIPTLEQLLSAIDAFLKRHDMAPSRFGREAVSDANLISALRGGASPSLNRMHRLRDYMARKDQEAGHDVGNTDASGGASAENNVEISPREKTDA